MSCPEYYLLPAVRPSDPHVLESGEYAESKRAPSHLLYTDIAHTKIKLSTPRKRG